MPPSQCSFSACLNRNISFSLVIQQKFSNLIMQDFILGTKIIAETKGKKFIFSRVYILEERDKDKNNDLIAIEINTYRSISY